MAELEAWSTFALAVLAGVAAFVAITQIRESIKLRKSTHRAYVTIHVEGDQPTRTLNAVLENTGLSTAENVRVTFDPELEAASESLHPAETSAVWNQPTMPPRKVVRTVLDVGYERAESDLPMVYTATVTYDSPATNEVGITLLYTLDFNASAYAVRQWDLVDQDTPRQTKALQSIADSLKVIVKGDQA